MPITINEKMHPLPEHIKIIQALRIHQKIIQSLEIYEADNQRNYGVDKCHIPPPSLTDHKFYFSFQIISARALYACKPIKKPQTQGTCDVENRLPNFGFQLRRFSNRSSISHFNSPLP
jgi:hypothetical protein